MPRTWLWPIETWHGRLFLLCHYRWLLWRSWKSITKIFVHYGLRINVIRIVSNDCDITHEEASRLTDLLPTLMMNISPSLFSFWCRILDKIVFLVLLLCSSNLGIIYVFLIFAMGAWDSVILFWNWSIMNCWIILVYSLDKRDLLELLLLKILGRGSLFFNLDKLFHFFVVLTERKFIFRVHGLVDICAVFALEYSQIIFLPLFGYVLEVFINFW